MAVGVKLGRIAEPAVVADQDVVDLLVGEIGVAGFCQVRPGRAGRDGGGQRHPFGPRAQHHRKRHAAAGRGAEDRHVLASFVFTTSFHTAIASSIAAG